MKLIVTWIAIIAMAAIGLATQCLPDDRRLEIIHMLGFMLLVICFIFVPLWISKSCWYVKQAIEWASRGNWGQVKEFLIVRGKSNYPSPRYADIVKLLLQLCANPEQKPKQASPEFDQYVVYNGFRYELTSEGKEKMIEKINSGWINGGVFESPKLLNILFRAFIIITVLKVIAVVVNALIHHH